MTRTTLITAVLMVIASWCAPFAAMAQEPPKMIEERVDQLESRVTGLDQKVRSLANEGIVLFLFGAFCALWAQNTRRNPWLWFFLGLFFSVITVIVLLVKNSKDRKA